MPASLIAASVPPRDINTSPPNGPSSDILDISHNVIKPLLPEMESLLPEMECSAQLQTTNNNDDLQTTDSLMIMTPSTLQKIDFIATPTVLYINKDYDLRSISDLDGVLQSIETQNISQDVVTTESEERPETPIEQLTKKRKVDPNLWKDKKNKILKNSGKSYESVRTNKQNAEKSIGPPCNCKLKCYEKLDQLNANMKQYLIQSLTYPSTNLKKIYVRYVQFTKLLMMLGKNN